MVLSKEIVDIDADIATWESGMKEQAYAREKAHADFVTTHEDYSESIASVSRAVQTIQEKSEASFTQVAQAWGGPDALMELRSQTARAQAHSTSKAGARAAMKRAQRVLATFLQRDV